MKPIVVVKVGGNLLDDAAWVDALAAGIAAQATDVVVVHGGGRELSHAQRLLGSDPQWRDGLRVTDAAALRAAVWALSGGINKQLVRALLNAGVDAIGMSGEDGSLLRASVSHGGELGRTGEVEAVRTDLLQALLAHGITPVVAPVSRGQDGGALNVNADCAAAAVAAALRASELLFISDVPGVNGVAGPCRSMDAGEVEAMIGTGVAGGGMAPKLRAAVRAAEGGVRRVRIGSLAMLADATAGTLIEAARALVGGAA